MEKIQGAVQSLGSDLKEKIVKSTHLPSRSLLILFVIWLPFAIIGASSALGFLLQLVTVHLHYLIGLAGGLLSYAILHKQFNPNRTRLELVIVLSAVLPILMIMFPPYTYLRLLVLIAFCGTPYLVKYHFLNDLSEEKR